MKTKAIITYISDWLKQYSERAKTKGLVVGISGGIDSAVSSTLAAKNGLPLLCVEMPIHQEESQIERGKDHINWLKNNFPNVSAINIELTSVFENLAKTLPKNTENIELVFENTGPVIEPKILEQIFDKFFTTKAHRNGTGLGLSIVKNVVDEHDATITVSSKKNSTKFTIYFPI